MCNADMFHGRAGRRINAKNEKSRLWTGGMFLCCQRTFPLEWCPGVFCLEGFFQGNLMSFTRTVPKQESSDVLPDVWRVFPWLFIRTTDWHSVLLKVKIHAQRTWTCRFPLKGGYNADIQRTSATVPAVLLKVQAIPALVFILDFLDTAQKWFSQ